MFVFCGVLFSSVLDEFIFGCFILFDVGLSDNGWLEICEGVGSSFSLFLNH